MMVRASTTTSRNSGGGDSKDLFRQHLLGVQQLIDAELTATVGAELDERPDTRTDQHNGSGL